jgi:hypothetical protein
MSKNKTNYSKLVNRKEKQRVFKLYIVSSPWFVQWPHKCHKETAGKVMGLVSWSHLRWCEQPWILSQNAVLGLGSHKLGYTPCLISIKYCKTFHIKSRQLKVIQTLRSAYIVLQCSIHCDLGVISSSGCNDWGVTPSGESFHPLTLYLNASGQWPHSYGPVYSRWDTALSAVCLNGD